MKHSIAILSLGLIISACQGPSKPAPYELKGTKFYGKSGSSNSEYIDDYSDSDNSDYVYKGRSGESSINSTYKEEQDFSKRKSAHSSDDDSGITSTKLAPPPKYTNDEPEVKPSQSKLVDDHIDQYEDEKLGRKSSSSVKVPTSRDKLAGYNDATPARAKSSDYLDLKPVEEQPSPNNLTSKKTRPVEEKPVQASYNGERSEKLRDIFPKAKPYQLEQGQETIEVAENSSSTQPEEAPADPKRAALANVSAKEKPRHLELADEDIEVKEKPSQKAEPKAEEEREVKAEVKPEPKPEPKVEAKVEPKAEPKPEPKVEAKKPSKAETALKEEDSGFISVPDKAPTAKAEVKKPEIKKAEIKKPEEPKQEKLEVVSEKVEKEPEPKKQDIASIPKMEPASASGPAKFVKPVDGKIVQEFGQGNDGIRIQAPEGTPVKAAAGGEVVYSGNELQGYGNMIVIKHPNGFLTAYSHLENLPVKKGEKVTQGEVIGAVGKTGNVQSPQLHFGVRKGRNAVNPRDYLN